METFSGSKEQDNQSKEKVPSVDSKKIDLDDAELQSAKSILENHGFKIMKSLGSGSYAKVKMAFSEHHQKVVAIKIISKYRVPEEYLKKFLYNEINIVPLLKHQNIIKYYQSIESSHRLYIIMQYAENGTMLDLIHKSKHISEELACDYFRQLLSAVEYIHNLGVCHRDIKCENVLLDKKNVVKLIDFGFSKILKLDKEQAAIDKGAEISVQGAIGNPNPKPPYGLAVNRKNSFLSETYCGSYAYASPEILSGTPYDPRMSDIWAMGVVLFAMLYGKLPYDDRDVKKLLKEVNAAVKIPDLPRTSDECKRFIRKILAPLNIRYNLERIKEDRWLTKFGYD